MSAWLLLPLLLLPADGPQGHSHNDYEQLRPLDAALDAGMASIEADVFPVSGRLLVAHEEKDLNPSRTLVGMYLQPMAERLAKGTRLRAGDSPLILLVDIKRDGRQSYELLATELKPFRRWLTRYRNGRVEPGRITVVLSGDRPVDVLAKEEDRFAFIDGRWVEGRAEPADPKLAPLVSDDWFGQFRWLGGGAFPDGERKRLEDMVGQVHRNGQQLRFWATPDVERFWSELRRARVDFIGTDDPARLQRFLGG